jgi:RNA polymerase sigma factor (sigma-70 family)
MVDQPDPHSTVAIQGWLDRLIAGDASSSQALLDASMDRLRHLTKRIIGDIPGVKRWEQTDDVLQNASIRLWRALDKHHPATPLDYYRLASSIIRRELIDLSRHYFGAEGIGANHARTGSLVDTTSGKPDFGSDTSNPEQLGQWTEFHEYVEALPEDDRLLFDLLWYQGLTLNQAAAITGSSERTMRRHWKLARLALYQKLVDTQHDG